LTWIHRPEPWMLDTVAEALGLQRERVEHLARHRSLRFREYRGLLYALLRREVADYPEGTVVVFGRGWWRLIRGYPSIRRMVLPSVALPPPLCGQDSGGGEDERLQREGRHDRWPALRGD